MTTTPPSRSAITFRAQTDDDVGFLRHLYGTTRDAELQIVPWSDDQKTAFLDMQFNAQTRHYEQFYPDCQFLVIEREGEPIGRLYVDHSEREIRLIDIALLPEHRGQGIGGMLLAELLAEAAATDRRVRIYVEHLN